MRKKKKNYGGKVIQAVRNKEKKNSQGNDVRFSYKQRCFSQLQQ